MNKYKYKMKTSSPSVYYTLLRRPDNRGIFRCGKISTRLTKIAMLIFLLAFLYFFLLGDYMNIARQYLSTRLESNQLRQYSYNHNRNRSRNLKTILLWNDFFGRKDFEFGEGRQPFIDSKCRINTCITTSDRQMFSADEIDALVWHGNSFDRSLPSERSPHTRYVYLEMESPENSLPSFGSLNGIFNYTMSYRRDSDVYFPYGYYREKTISLNTTKRNYAAEKTKMAAWIVSHCFTSSQRETLVDTLKEFISVDVYGSCGPLECGTSNRESCYRMELRDYKFYLAFENSLCVDYATEKFFYSSKHDIVPVVYGLADYKKIAPPKSYINVMDFKNVKELAEYLIYLDKNDTAYNEYFDWKSTHESVPIGHEHWCELCSKLHSDKEPKVYSDLKGWYETDKCKEVDQNITQNWFWNYKSKFKRVLDMVYFRASKISHSLLPYT